MQWVEYSIVASSEIKAAQRDIDENLKVGAQVVHQIESYRILREGRAPILVTEVIGHQQARKFYSTPNKKGKIIMEKPVFDSVNWGAVNLALSGKYRMYQLWYGKQCLG